MLDDPNDERFEAYLKQFRPLPPGALPLEEIAPVLRREFTPSRAVGAVVALVVVALAILGVASLRIFHHRVTVENGPSAVKFLATPPLTLRTANALLATSPSYRAVMNELAFPTESSRVPKDKRSALAVLGKEKIKL